MSIVFHFALGTLFGWILSRSGAADYDYIQAMFRFENFQLYGIIGTAVLVTAPGLLLLKRYPFMLSGRPFSVKAKPLHPGNVAGGVLFGIGWSITGMCPGPILVNVGEGKVYAVAALAGALCGAAAFASSYRWLRAPLRLPEVKLGTGDG
jgi:uncharacterized membrane protein YedE/YeeE